MSWTLTGTANVPAPEARELIAGNTQLPQPIKDYIITGIDGLVKYHDDENLPVTISGYGHVCDGQNYDVTSATIEVKRGAIAEGSQTAAQRSDESEPVAAAAT
jgi:hypothetical protein